MLVVTACAVARDSRDRRGGDTILAVHRQGGDTILAVQWLMAGD